MFVRVVVSSLLILWLGASVVACETERVSSPTKQQALQTKGTLPDPNGIVLRRFRSPLDAIAPEDPPVPNRGLITYIPTADVSLPTNILKFETIGRRGGVANTGGVVGAAMGNLNQGGSLAARFGDGKNSNGGSITLTGLEVGQEGWSVAYWAGLAAEASPKSVLSTFTFSNRSPIQVFADAGSKKLTLTGLSSVPNLEVKVNATFGAFEYHHVGIIFTPLNRNAFTGKDPGTLAIYFDGQLAHTEAGTFGSLSSITFGSTKIGQTEVLSYAALDDIFTYRTSLSEGEMQALYTKPQKGIARVWPAAMPLNVLDAAPYTQARANAASTVLGTFALAGPVERQDDEKIANENSDFQNFTYAGWYFIPEDAPKNVDLFSIRADKLGTIYVRIAVENQTPYAEVSDGTNTDRLTGGSRFAVTRGAWHFVALTRSPRALRLYVDSELTAETAPSVPPFLAASLQSPTLRAAYGLYPTAWTVGLSRESSAADLEALRSPGPRIWLNGSSSEVTVSTALAAIAASGFTGALDGEGTPQSPPETQAAGQKTRRIVAPNDYGGHCVFESDAGVCDPVATYGGVGGVSVGREGSIRLSRELGGRVQIPATRLLRDKLGVSFSVYLEPGTEDRVPLFARDFPTLGAGPPTDARIDAQCYSGFFCALAVTYPPTLGSTARKTNYYTLVTGKWTKIAVGFNGTSEPVVAIDGALGEIYTTSESEEPAGSDVTSLSKEQTARLRFGFDMREYSTSTASPFDIDEIRVYARPMSPMELTTLTASCENMSCDISSRQCFAGFTKTATPLCSNCLSDTYVGVENNPLYGMTNTVCLAKQAFAAQCASDSQCASGVCIDSFCGSSDEAATREECFERRRDVRRQGSAPRFTCGKCYAFHDPPLDASPIGACVWKPPKKHRDVVGAGNEGSFDKDATPGFDTYECNSGHAVTTTEPKFSVIQDERLPSLADQADKDKVRRNSAGQVRVDPIAKTELRSRCTPAMPDGCSQCETNPKPAFCTQEFVNNVCFKSGCKACSQEGMNCNTSQGYPFCTTCRPNFRPQRTFLTPEACAKVFNSLNEFQVRPTTAWNNSRWRVLFDERPIPFPTHLMSLTGIGLRADEEEGRPSYLSDLEKQGVGVPYTRFGEKRFYQKCEGRTYVYTPAGFEMTNKGVCNGNYEELYEDATRLVGGKSLHLYDCVLPDSAFQSSYNDEICVSVKNPRGATCPPLNPQTGLPEEGDGDNFCETGYCGRSLGVCTDGGVQQEKVARKDSAEQSSSGFDVGVFGVNVSSLVATKHDVTSTGRTSVSRFAYSLTAKVMAFLDIKVFDFSGQITTDGIKDPHISTTYELLGASLPPDQKPVAACTNASWSDDGDWEGTGECEINLDQPPGPPKLAVKFPVAEDAKEKFEKSRTFMAGYIPIQVKAALVVDAGIGLEAGFSDAEIEARFGIKPVFAVGVEVSGGIGGEVEAGPLTFGASAGLRAAITLIELALPSGWNMQIEQETDESGKALNRFYITDRADISLEMSILSLAFSIYAEVELGIFSIEWEYLIVELKNLTFKKSLLSGPKREFVLDLE